MRDVHALFAVDSRCEWNSMFEGCGFDAGLPVYKVGVEFTLADLQAAVFDSTYTKPHRVALGGGCGPEHGPTLELEILGISLHYVLKEAEPASLRSGAFWEYPELAITGWFPDAEGGEGHYARVWWTTPTDALGDRHEERSAYVQVCSTRQDGPPVTPWPH